MRTPYIVLSDFDAVTPFAVMNNQGDTVFGALDGTQDDEPGWKSCWSRRVTPASPPEHPVPLPGRHLRPRSRQSRAGASSPVGARGTSSRSGCSTRTSGRRWTSPACSPAPGRLRRASLAGLIARAGPGHQRRREHHRLLRRPERGRGDHAQSVARPQRAGSARLRTGKGIFAALYLDGAWRLPEWRGSATGDQRLRQERPREPQPDALLRLHCQRRARQSRPVHAPTRLLHRGHRKSVPLHSAG